MARNTFALLATLALFVLPCKAEAQANRAGAQDTASARRAAEQRLGRPITHEEIVERLRRSGLSRAEVRARLQQAGYSPDLANEYFDAMDRGTRMTGAPDDSFKDALQRIGLAGREREESADTLERRLPVKGREPLEEADTVAVPELEVFGLRTFRRASTQFEPPAHGPVDAGYRIGPGDEVLLVLTGDVEAAYQLDVTREGFIFIPDVGQVNVNGITLAEMQDLLYSRLGRVYSGVSRSPNASTRFQVSLGALRANQIMVSGDVVRPGSYLVSGVAGLFNALYHAGGPTENGSFRRVEVHRGGRVAHVADLYDFLIRGNGASDIRLEHNDRIFVPPAGAQARIEGSVRRPAIYEVREGEGVADLLAFAGGLRSDALIRRVQIDRIVPPGEQRPGYYRTLVDVDLGRLHSGEHAVAIHDGDIVNVFSVSDSRRNRIWVEGEVRNPGLYEWSRGSTLWTALERADGLAEHAYTPRVHIYRLDERDGVRHLLAASLDRDAAGNPVHDVPLMDNDSIVVISRLELRTPETVFVTGFVKNEGPYTLARGMTLKDLILAAGGFTEGAYVLEAELTRMTNPLVRNDTTAYVARVRLVEGEIGGNGNGNGSGSWHAPGGAIIPEWAPATDEVALLPGDRVFVRRAPGYEATREVRVTGEVFSPGTYVLTTRDERLTDVIARAGGLTPQANAEGMHVVRRERIVAASLERALRNPRDHNNIMLAEGDSIHVPANDPMVVVTGAVNFEARVLHMPGRGANFYINQAGGLIENADLRRATITYANGQRAPLLGNRLTRSSARVEPGSHIFVPDRQQRDGPNWDTIISRTLAAVSAAATLLIAINR